MSRAACRWVRGRSVAQVVLLLLLSSPAAAAEGSHLGGHPLCEASAAAWIPCPDDDLGTCLLIADNEQRQTLVAIPFDGRRLHVARRLSLDLRPVLSAREDHELSDIEALTVLGSGDVLVFGSHGRDKACKPRKKRRRFVSLKVSGRSVEEGDLGLVRTKKDFPLWKAFPKHSQGTLGAVREAVKAAEKAAGDTCGGAFDVEGVVALPGPGGDEIWVGLRSPLVEGKAVLVRLVGGGDALAFDAARLVDLDGQGIRDLTYARGWVWGLSGPLRGDSLTTRRLWRFRVGALGRDEIIGVDSLAGVPSGSEGLAIWGDRALVVTDGEQPQQGATPKGSDAAAPCEIDATYQIVRIPW